MALEWTKKYGDTWEAAIGKQMSLTVRAAGAAGYQWSAWILGTHVNHHRIIAQDVCADLEAAKLAAVEALRTLAKKILRVLETTEEGVDRLIATGWLKPSQRTEAIAAFNGDTTRLVGNVQITPGKRGGS
jgi:hypothetical protein